MSELISVIVPIYNVEKYLKKAVDCIVRQTYDNIEIILVDDGSTDNCGLICDEYYKKDNRIKVIHKENGGASEARNAGIEIAKGEYFAFIDPDDWIENNMIEVLYNNIKKYDADISICEYIKETIKGKVLKKKSGNKEIQIFNKKSSLCELIMQKNITNHIWNKLYKKKLFNEIRFPKGKLLEDISITYKLFEKSDKIVYQNISLYHYINRNSSILNRMTEKGINDLEEAVFSRNKYLLNKYPELYDIITIDNLRNVKSLYYFSIIGNYNKLYGSLKFKKYYNEYKTIYKKYKSKIQEDKKSIRLFYTSKNVYILWIHIKKWINRVRGV